MATLIKADFVTKEIISRQELAKEAENSDKYTLIIEVDGLKVKYPVPKTADEYIVMCKKFLTREDYRDILVSLKDNETYESLDERLKNIIACYRTYLPPEEQQNGPVSK